MASRRLRNQPTVPLQDRKITVHGGTKRPCEGRSPEKLQNKRVKRATLGDITNKTSRTTLGKKPGQKKATKPGTKTKTTGPLKATKVHEESLKSSESLLEEIDSSQGSSVSSQSSINSSNVTLSQESKAVLDPEIDNVDTENLGDPFQVALYALDIFNYYKEREVSFAIPDYMRTLQRDLTAHMRSILVDWQVEVQENFELNHETLYLAVKLVDHYLARVAVPREQLQLVGATALFIACKFDERCPPMLDDFLYICDDAYAKTDLILMEQRIVRAVNFDLGIPLTYRFLRRYAKCCRASVETLTLARYILEMSLMDYKVIQIRDSLTAAAALLLALRMKNVGQWTPTLVYYTGYTEQELLPLVRQLNTMVAAPPNAQLNTIRTKYSHRVFHEVAKIPALSELDLAAAESDDANSSTTSSPTSSPSTSTSSSPASSSPTSSSPASS